ncbi:MAG: T9SS type A sorting domain-containing protein [Bacteroidota bacterium]|jgi:hypothetical protein
MAKFYLFLYLLHKQFDLINFFNCHHPYVTLFIKGNVKNKTLLLIIVSFFSFDDAIAQPYSPAAGIIGTKAMHKDSSAFVNWANSCTIIRGYQNIGDKALGLANAGDHTLALGKAQTNGVVSLGDSGIAICQFPFSIKNGNGNDFAVFENSFDGLFLELAFVEVSSDGVNFFRFPSHSLTSPSVQIGPFDFLDATNIHHLAGKYQAAFGTPFDLSEINDHPLLNKNAITHVKIIDCIGSINNLYATRDSDNNIINDPWPTPFGTSGFDLDAIGVINQNTITGLAENKPKHFIISPNPIRVNENLAVYSDENITQMILISPSGIVIPLEPKSNISFPEVIPGVYTLRITSHKNNIHKKIVVIK